MSQEADPENATHPLLHTGSRNNISFSGVASTAHFAKARWMLFTMVVSFFLMIRGMVVLMSSRVVAFNVVQLDGLTRICRYLHSIFPLNCWQGENPTHQNQYLHFEGVEMASKRLGKLVKLAKKEDHIFVRDCCSTIINIPHWV